MFCKCSTGVSSYSLSSSFSLMVCYLLLIKQNTLLKNFVPIPFSTLQNEVFLISPYELSDMNITMFIDNTIISKLDPKKDSALDVVLVIIIKKCAPVLTPLLSKYYNKIAVSCFLTCGKYSGVFHVFRNSGESSDRSNYFLLFLAMY